MKGRTGITKPGTPPRSSPPRLWLLGRAIGNEIAQRARARRDAGHRARGRGEIAPAHLRSEAADDHDVAARQAVAAADQFILVDQLAAHPIQQHIVADDPQIGLRHAADASLLLTGDLAGQRLVEVPDGAAGTCPGSSSQFVRHFFGKSSLVFGSISTDLCN